MFGAPGQPAPKAAGIPVPSISSMAATAAISPDQRYRGTVKSYYKFQGYGFITLGQTGLVPKDAVFVYWKNLKSTDRFPSLTTGMEVEFNVAEETKYGKKGFSAKDVSLPGGATISIQD